MNNSGLSEAEDHGTLPQMRQERHVTTILTLDERLRVDAAAMGAAHMLHRDSIDDVLRDLRGNRADAILVSTAYCQHTDVTRIARVVREFPRTPAVALLSQLDSHSARAILALGQYGFRTLIDVRDPSGWKELRSVLLSERATDIQRLAIAQLAIDLAEAPLGAQRFFEILFRTAPRTVTIRQLALTLQVSPSTLMSRFFRARMPPPKRYLAYARLTCAAYLFENHGLSIAAVANQLEFSSPQSFGRHVRTMLGITAVTFRERYDGHKMLDRFREDLIVDYLVRWKSFDPIADPVMGQPEP